MKFSELLVSGRLVRRYKRFLCDVQLDTGELTTAHCPNPGSMLGLKDPGSQVWLMPIKDKNRKLPYSWELINVNEVLVGINAGRANRIVEEALITGAIDELGGYGSIRREGAYGTRSRIDFLLESGRNTKCFVEVKNVHLSRVAGLAEFPDSVTARGLKHLEELSKVVSEGGRGVMLYLVQRGDCNGFSVAGDIDSAYAEAFLQARDAGVQMLCYRCEVSTESVVLNERLELAC